MIRGIILSHAAIRSSNRSVFRALQERGINVTLVIPDRWKTVYGELRAEPEPPGSSLEVIVRRRVGISHSNVYGIADSLVGLTRSANSVFYVEEDPAGILAAQAAAAARISRSGLVILAIQNILKRYPAPFELMQKLAFGQASAAVSTSNAAASVLAKRGFRGTIVPMPFSTDLTEGPAEQREQTRAQYGLSGYLVGYVGRLVPEKGVDILLSAISKVPQATGVIVGDGPLRESLTAQAVSLGLERRTHFLGSVSPTEATRLIGALDVLSLPSLSRPNWAEQFGRVLIEAMATGVPIIASNSGSIGEVVGDAGILVPEGDIDALAGAISQMIHPTTSRDLKIRGLQRVDQRFRRENEISGLVRAFELAAGMRQAEPLAPV